MIEIFYIRFPKNCHQWFFHLY